MTPSAFVRDMPIILIMPCMSMLHDFMIPCYIGIISATIFCGLSAKISTIEGMASFMNANFSSLASILNWFERFSMSFLLTDRV
jgi:hypothetical protein